MDRRIIRIPLQASCVSRRCGGQDRATCQPKRPRRANQAASRRLMHLALLAVTGHWWVSKLRGCRNPDRAAIWLYSRVACWGELGKLRLAFPPFPTILRRLPVAGGALGSGRAIVGGGRGT